MPNARETASLIWLGLLLVLVLSRRDGRQSTKGVFRLVFGRKVGTSLLLLVLWIVGEVTVARRLNWWNWAMVTSTVFWSVGNGIVLFANAVTERTRGDFFRRYLLKTLRVSVFLGVFMSFSVLSLPLELLLQPFVFLLVGSLIVAGTKSELAQVRVFLNVVLALTIAALAAYEVAALVGSTDVLGRNGLAWQFFLPVWLAVGLLPFVYAGALWAGYEQAFVRTEWENGRHVGRRLALAATFGLRYHALDEFVKASAWYLRDVATYRETRLAIRSARLREPDDYDFDESDDV
jgi:hypothetical protein